MEDLTYIVKGALMTCDEGLAPDYFKPTSNTKTKVKDLVVATSADFIPLTNIPSFKICKKTKKPCVPETSKWNDTWPAKIGSNEILVGRCKCKCDVGGTIEFITSGQIPLPQDTKDKVEELQDQAQKELDDSGNGNSVGEAGFAEGMIPVWGPARDTYNAYQTDDTKGMFINGAFLLWDVGSIVVGIFTAGGGTAAMQSGKAGLKGTMKAGVKKISSKAIDKLAQLSIKGIVEESIEKGIKEALEKGIKEVTACFTGDTLVHTELGFKPIKDIQIGEKVYSYDIREKQVLLNRISNVFTAEVDSIIEITLENDTKIKTTPSHPFHVREGWRDAQCLKIGDFLFTNQKLWHKIKLLNYFNEKIKVYNLNIENTHCYFVSVDGVLVHNDCDILFKSADELAKNLGTTVKDFHKNIKPLIKKDAAEYMKKIGSTNPDIGANAAGQIVLKNPQTKKEIVTDLLLDWYKN